jgi:hypothetical protein
LAAVEAERHREVEEAEEVVDTHIRLAHLAACIPLWGEAEKSWLRRELAAR